MTTQQKRNPQELLILLKERQAENGCLSDEILSEIAECVNLPLNEVYGVATFYHFISARPLGRNVIRICKSVPCYLKSGEMVIKALEEKLGIGPGETTSDGRFSLLLTNCIGACDQAPSMMINNDVHVNLMPEKISEILKSYK